MLTVHPLNERDAVESFSIVVRFPSSVAEDVFQGTLNFVRGSLTAKLDLPGENRVQEFAFRVGAVLDTTQSASSGINFQRYSRSGEVEAELRLERVAFALTLRAYPGWQFVTKEITPHLCDLVERYYASTGALGSISMQYQNRFLAGGDDVGSVDWDGAVLSESDWVATKFASEAPYWHCHTGAFEPTRYGVRRLINVNVDVQDFQRRATSTKSMSIIVLASDQHQVEGYTPVAIEGNRVCDYFYEELESLHARIKELLSEILSESCKTAIGFSKSIS